MLKGAFLKYPARQRAIVAAIRTAREAANLSQRELSAKLREPPNWVQRVESLERRIDVAEFVAIARAMNVDPLALLADALRG
jgi:ribosome-binding protein aMBF1 (putative translation factor)